MKKYFMVLSLLFLVACTESFNEDHEDYLKHEGWIINKKISEHVYVLHSPEEMLTNYDTNRLPFLRDYQNQEVTEYRYLLQEKEIGGENLKAIIFEQDGKIIGGYGLLPSWTPGIFNLKDQERLITENVIRQH